MTTLLSDLVPIAANGNATAIAMRDHQSQIAYGELEHKTAQLAHCLQAAGVEPEDRVAICMPTSVLTGIAVHGVFRAGGAFVPIDPDAPPLRIRSILESCEVRHVLATEHVRSKLLEACAPLDVTLLVGTGGDLDHEVTWDTVWEQPRGFREADRDPERLAYVMFTSGSTGTPKGIAHTHRSGMSYARNSAALYGITSDDVIATTGPLHFDISTLAYLTAPAAGATAIVMPLAYTRMPASLSHLLASTGVSVFYTTASGLSQFIDRGALDTRDLSTLRWVLFCGEPLAPAKLNDAMRALPSVWFSNVYGPAEVNQCTCFNIAPGTDATMFDGQIPIGRPGVGATCKVLDGDQEVATGEEGELAIHAPTMMTAYWGRPDLNEGAFHFDGEGRRFYRSGDVVRTTPQGDYVLVGRKDRQIKVRGYRVELDEIEIVLAEHPGVKEVAAFPIVSQGSITAIGAAVVPRAGFPDLRNELNRFLNSRLPVYAVPEKIDHMLGLPRTSNGKLDRRKLSLASSEDREKRNDEHTL